MQNQRIPTVLAEIAVALQTASNNAREMVILADQKDVEYWREKSKEWLLDSHAVRVGIAKEFEPEAETK